MISFILYKAMFGWVSLACFTEEESSCLPIQYQASFFFSCRSGNFFAVLFPGGGGPGIGLFSSVTVGAFLMSYWFNTAANFTAHARLRGLFVSPLLICVSLQVVPFFK